MLTIDPGDTVQFTTLEAMWCVERRPARWPWRQVEPRRPVLDDGHALTGPVEVRGASPGTTLAIEIGPIVPADWAWTFSGPQGERARALGLDDQSPYAQFWDIDPGRGVATDPAGRRVRLRPFMGVMGVAPPEPGIHSTTPPRAWGGNIDCRELVTGTTLYLPVGVDGALFSVGDGHAAQGDGEVCGNAIECPMDRVDLTFHLIDQPLDAPRARTAEAWVTFGFDPDLNRATMMALSGMLDLLQEQRNIPRQEALALASVAADLRITQIVNGSQGVHAVLTDDALG